jgi:chorismate mutase
VKKKAKTQLPASSRELAALRVRIDRADRRLFAALADRFGAVERIGAIKRREGLPVLQKRRWQELRRDRLRRARALGLGGGFAAELLELIHREALRAQGWRPPRKTGRRK